MLTQHPRVQWQLHAASWVLIFIFMASVIRGFDYSKARGRGRGILGMKDFDQCRKPGAGSVETSSEAKGKEGG